MDTSNNGDRNVACVCGTCIQLCCLSGTRNTRQAAAADRPPPESPRKGGLIKEADVTTVTRHEDLAIPNAMCCHQVCPADRFPI